MSRSVWSRDATWVTKPCLGFGRKSPISSCTSRVLCVPVHLTTDASELHKIQNEMGLQTRPMSYRAVLGNRVDTGWNPLAACLRAKKWSQMLQVCMSFTIITVYLQSLRRLHIGLQNSSSCDWKCACVKWFLSLDFRPRRGLHLGQRHIGFVQQVNYWILYTSLWSQVFVMNIWTQWMKYFLMFRIYRLFQVKCPHVILLIW